MIEQVKMNIYTDHDKFTITGNMRERAVIHVAVTSGGNKKM